jgi:hypothetical protein
VRIVNPMLELLWKPIAEYKPEGFEGLLPETGDPQTSVKNVQTLVDAGLAILSAVAGPGGVLFIFQTGETFLANGFGLGGGPKTEALAYLISAIGVMPYQDVLRLLVGDGLDNWVGPIPNLKWLADPP